MNSSKKGISSHQIARELGIQVKSAWFLTMRIREAMKKEPLAGLLQNIVEVDETYVGGKPRKHTGKHKRGRGTEKTPVLVLVERDGNARVMPLENVSSKSLKGERLVAAHQRDGRQAVDVQRTNRLGELKTWRGLPVRDLFENTSLDIRMGDSLTILPDLPAESVQCCVTSPPYWGLRDYNHPAQIGAEPSPDLYVNNLVAIFKALRRVLRKDGTLWLNVGDGYARNGGTGVCGPNAIVGNTKKLIQKRNCKVPECWGLKDRDLMGLPWRVAFGLQADGWILRSRITWIKKTAMPESVKNRPTNATEDIFMFAKSPTYFYNPQGIRESTGANLRNYWILGPEPNINGHPAAFPCELARRCVLLGSRENDTVIDPFAGSGTVGKVASELGRNAILIELNPKYAQMTWKRHGQRKRL